MVFSNIELHALLCSKGEGQMEKLLVLGAGGFGQVVRELAEELGYEVAFLDDAARGNKVIGRCMDYEALFGSYKKAVAAFGNNRLRLRWVQQLLEAGYEVPALVHPTAWVSPSVSMGDGCIVLQNAVVNTRSQLGKACLINCGAVIDHDNRLEDGVHIGLSAIIKANCCIKPLQKIEAGTVIFSTRRKIDGVDNLMLEDALYAFGFGNTCSFVKPFGAGHINETYAVYMPQDDGKEELSYILQRVNINVFKKPKEVMENIMGVTEFLRKRIMLDGGNPDRETLSYIRTKAGENFFEDSEGKPWRCYNFIENSICYQAVERPEQFYESAKSFGNFLKQLSDYPADTLHETIPRFHDTESRFMDFEKAVERDVKDRASKCAKEILFVQNRKEDCAVLMNQLHSGKLPLRVTHNDTKLNNILFDEESGKGLCIIDLDTIMPGLAANDFGDSIRFGATTAAEDEPDLSKVNFDIGLYELYVKGYLEAAGGILTEAEKESLAWGARIITLECGIRFLTDFLQGDTYFKTERPMHNLERARTQFKLVADMEKQFDQMLAIVKKYC